MKKIKGRPTRDINVSGAEELKGRFFLAEGFLNGIHVLFPLTIKLGRVVYNFTLYQLKPLLLN